MTVADANLGPMPWAIAQTDCWPGTAKVMEECGELVQVLAKLIALGAAGIHWDGTDLRDRITEEIGDLTGALRFFIHHNDVDRAAISERARVKYDTFVGWHNDRMQTAGTSDYQPSAPNGENAGSTQGGDLST